MRVLFAALTVLAAGPAAAQEIIDHPQWIYRDIHGTEGAAAVFLSWDYRSVVIRAICERDEDGVGTLLIEYFPDVDSVAADPPLALIVDEQEAFMATTLSTSGGLLAMQGRLPANAELGAVVAAGLDFQLDAPNTMGEPWYLDGAQPLKRLVGDCVVRTG